MISASTKGARVVRLLTLVLLVAAAFLLSHPYTGVRHDGTLYAGEALARLLPGGFRDDIYFEYGSQGRFTLLPALYAALIERFGIGGGTMVGLLSAFAAYLAAATYVIAAIAPRRLRVACLLSIALGWTLYGGTRVFGYSEPFFTARSFAEPVVLLGVGLLLRGHVVVALIALSLALAIHPLIAVAGLLVAWLFLLQEDRRWAILAVLAAVALCGLGFFRLGPFADVFERYDIEWLALVREANPQAFVFLWSLLDYGVIAFDVVALGFAIRLAVETRTRRMFVAAVIAGVGATLVSALLVDVAHNPFFGKLQVWRAEWIMQWLAMASLPVTMIHLWKRDACGRVISCLLAMGWMAPFSYAPALLGAICILLESFRSRIEISVPTVRMILGVTIVTGISIVAQSELRSFSLGLMLEQGVRQIASQALGTSIVVLALCIAVLRGMPAFGRASLLVALIMFAGAAFLWDQRGPWTRTLEAYVPGQPLWPGLIEPTAKVYWYRNLIAPWILLGHGNYYTAQQGSGSVFSRDMTIELERRSKLTGALDLQEQICRLMNNLNGKQSACEPDVLAVHTLCVEGGVDYVVLQSRLEGASPLASVSTGVVEQGYEKRFFLYRCSALNPR